MCLSESSGENSQSGAVYRMLEFHWNPLDSYPYSVCSLLGDLVQLPSQPFLLYKTCVKTELPGRAT